MIDELISIPVSQNCAGQQFDGIQTLVNDAIITRQKTKATCLTLIISLSLRFPADLVFFYGGGRERTFGRNDVQRNVFDVVSIF